jgi:replicative DNA helicase
MPRDIAAEQAVLGGLLVDGSAIAQVVDVLEAGSFYQAAHQAIYAAAAALYRAGRPIDHVTLPEALRQAKALANVGGSAYLAELAEKALASANIEHHARLVVAAARRRALIEAGRRSIALGLDPATEADEAVNQAQAAHFALVATQQGGGFVPVAELMEPAMERMHAQLEGRPVGGGVPSGFPDLDRLLGGFKPGDLVVVAARPSMGKTSFAMQVAAHAAIDHGVPTAVFSLEVSRSRLVDQMLCRQARVDHQRLDRGVIGENEIERLTNACGPLADARLWIDDSSTLDDLTLMLRARQARSRHDVGLIVVDYLGLLSSKAGGRNDPNRVQEVSAITRSLKAVARELDVPVIALSQLSRAPEMRQNKRPILSDLRDSGEVEQTADVVVFLYRDDYYNRETTKPGVAEVIVAKQRNGPIGMVELVFRREHTRFESVARSSGPGMEP